MSPLLTILAAWLLVACVGVPGALLFATRKRDR